MIRGGKFCWGNRWSWMKINNQLQLQSKFCSEINLKLNSLQKLRKTFRLSSFSSKMHLPGRKKTYSCLEESPTKPILQDVAKDDSMNIQKRVHPNLILYLEIDSRGAFLEFFWNQSFCCHSSKRKKTWLQLNTVVRILHHQSSQMQIVNPNF